MKVIIVNTGTSDVDRLHPELINWARGTGVDTRLATTQFVIAEDAAGRCAAHFSIKRQRGGHDYLAPGSDRVATDYGSFVAEVDRGSWPKWFGDFTDVPDVPIPALLEILAAAQGARTELSYRARLAAGVAR